MARATKSTYLLAGVVLGVAGVWLGWLALHGELGDLAEFVIDRREGAGQTQPDRGAECQYDLAGNQLLVTRKAHGQTAQDALTLADELVEPHFGGQMALIETVSSIDTYNCINGEFLTQSLKQLVLGGNFDEQDPIGRVLFSGTGRNVAVMIMNEGRESDVAVFSYKTNPGDSAWNKDFGPVHGDVLYRKINGESLIIVIASESGPQVHTYNFRSSHKNRPWNEFDLESRSFNPPGELTGSPEFSNQGKRVELEVAAEGQNVRYGFDYTCKQVVIDSSEPSDKPCVWSVVQ